MKPTTGSCRNAGRAQGGTREYIRILMLLKDHPLQEVTAAVEQASTLRPLQL